MTTDLIPNLFEGVAPAVLAWLLTYLIHSTVLIGSVWAVLAFWKKAPYLLRDTLWKTALVGGLITASVNSLGYGPAPWRVPIAGTAAVEQTAPSAAPDSTPAPRPNLAVYRPIRVAYLPELERSTEAGHFQPMPGAVESVPEAPAARQSVTPSRPSAGESAWGALLRPFLTWRWAVSGLWVLGALTGVAFHFASSVRFFRSLGTRRFLTEGPLVRLLERVLFRAKVSQPVFLTVSARTPVPLALGLSEICVPQRAVNHMDTEHQEAMLAHELAHLIRRDPAWLRASALISSVFFFQPLNRIARHGQRQAAEFLADDWVVQQTGRPLTLAKCLAEVASWIERDVQRGLLPAAAATGSPLVQRIERLLNAEEPARRIRGRGWWLAAGTATIGIMALFAPGVSAGGRDKHQAPVPPSSGIVVHKSALPEPVALAATPLTPEPFAAPAPPAPPAPPAVYSIRQVPGGYSHAYGTGDGEGTSGAPGAFAVAWGDEGNCLVFAGDDDTSRTKDSVRKFMRRRHAGTAPEAWAYSFGEPFQRAKRQMIGIGLGEPDEALASHLGLESGEGILVTEVHENMPAAKAGIQKHDIITSLDGKSPVTGEMLSEAIEAKNPGETITLGGLRGGKEFTAIVTIEEAVEPPAPSWDGEYLRAFGKLGDAEFPAIMIPNEPFFPDRLDQLTGPDFDGVEMQELERRLELAQQWADEARANAPDAEDGGDIEAQLEEAREALRALQDDLREQEESLREAEAEVREQERATKAEVRDQMREIERSMRDLEREAAAREREALLETQHGQIPGEHDAAFVHLAAELVARMADEAQGFDLTDGQLAELTSAFEEAASDAAGQLRRISLSIEREDDQPAEAVLEIRPQELADAFREALAKNLADRGVELSQKDRKTLDQAIKRSSESLKRTEFTIE
ncbi:PDZ domain-containing protein [Candidatus Poribacteria bacterium]|nr:PDZ domain-containing protein [Candidatus Poribacteria bacterium]